jgi:hypothetical protein
MPAGTAKRTWPVLPTISRQGFAGIVPGQSRRLNVALPVGKIRAFGQSETRRHRQDFYKWKNLRQAVGKFYIPLLSNSVSTRKQGLSPHLQTRTRPNSQNRVYKMKKPGPENHANHDRKNGQLFLFGNHANGSITL